MTKEIENFAFNCLQKLIYSHMGRKCTILQIPDSATTVALAWEESRRVDQMWLKRVYRPFLLPVWFTVYVSDSCTGLTREFGKGQFNDLKNGFSSVVQSCPTLCDPMNCSSPGLPVHHQLQEFTQTHFHRVSDAIQPSHPLLSPSPPAPNPSQHHSLFQ